MASKHTVKCYRCGSQFDVNNGGAYNSTSRRYMCPNCSKIIEKNRKNAVYLNKIIDNPSLADKNKKKDLVFYIICSILGIIGIISILAKQIGIGIVLVGLALFIFIKVFNRYDFAIRKERVGEDEDTIYERIKQLNEGNSVPALGSGGHLFCSFCGEEVSKHLVQCPICGSYVI